MKPWVPLIISLSIPFVLAFSSNGAELGTRQQTILPVAIPPGTPGVAPSNVVEYATYGYSAWQPGAGANTGRQFLTLTESTAATNSARLVSFFSLSDIHITDKESPIQVPYLGWSAGFTNTGLAGLNPSAYSPVVLATTFRLDAAVRTINACHRLTPFDFGMALGDNCNSAQYNELRWFIDVLDGQWIIPSSGTNAGAGVIDYQTAYQAAGLNPSIPWYEAIGNHDQMWMGIGYPSDKVQQAAVGTNILSIATNTYSPLITGAAGGGMYVGVVDGTTAYGTVIGWGYTNLYNTPPTVASDTNRHLLTTDIFRPTNYINEFFKTTSFPVGHGFNLANTGSLAACYSFLPTTNLPLKVIVLDDTCKLDQPGHTAAFYGGGWVDATRYSWLTNELQMGQDSNQLMILACHIPIKPQISLLNTNPFVGQFYLPNGNGQPGDATNYPGCKTEDELIATFHNYPNLLMVMAGHRHLNVVTPFPTPDATHPEYGFWEVETPSLRDFPQQVRTYEILRNSDNTISILTTDVDPVVETNTPAWKSLGYAIGASRVFGTIALDDTSSQTYNAELVKHLTPAMQMEIAKYGTPVGHKLAIDRNGTGAMINFLGELQSANNVSGPWSNIASTSPFTTSATNAAIFYRAIE